MNLEFTTLKRAERLRQSVLGSAFSGGLAMDVTERVLAQVLFS